MSIVERALGKARASGPQPARPAQREAAPWVPGIDALAAHARSPACQVQLKAQEGSAIHAFWAGSADSAVLNHFRGLRRELLARLQPVVDGGTAPLVLVTSPMPGDGKTFVSMAIARTFARAPDRQTVLVDLDLVRHSATSLFDAQELPGLMECMGGQADLRAVTCTTDVPRLQLVPAGGGDGESREAYVGDGIGEQLELLRQQGPGTVCFLDAPPVLPVVETALLVDKVDLVLLVIRAGQTPQAAVLESLARLGPNAKVCIVLNSVVHSHTGEYYDYNNYEAPGKN